MAPEGYAKIAQFMSNHGEFAIFRRFSRLNLQNILYLQAELTQLEIDLDELAERDKLDPSREFYAKDWWSLAESSDDEEGKEQWEKVLQIRQKLKQYNDQLSHQFFLTNLQAPKAHDLTFLQSWLRRPKMGNFPLRGPDQHAWSTTSSTTTHDLLALHRRSSTDPISHWVSSTCIPFLHRRCLHRFKQPLRDDPESGISAYADGALALAMNVLSTVVASMLPIASIVILYFVHDTLDRLAIAVAFTGVFALCLVLTTRARRVEIFAATSTFAAVQVVFITGDNGYVA